MGFRLERAALDGRAGFLLERADGSGGLGLRLEQAARDSRMAIHLERTVPDSCRQRRGGSLGGQRRFREFRQGNLGGSGGYSRIMYEALGNTDSPFILYMDDDIAIEPDSVLRAVQAARYAAKPIIVGGQMLNLQERSQLRTTGERVNFIERRGRYSVTTTKPSGSTSLARLRSASANSSLSGT